VVLAAEGLSVPLTKELIDGGTKIGEFEVDLAKSVIAIRGTDEHGIVSEVVLRLDPSFSAYDAMSQIAERDLLFRVEAAVLSIARNLWRTCSDRVSGRIV